MNIFARGTGGFCSDWAHSKAGLRGRLWCQALLLVAEGSLIIMFSFTNTMGGAVVIMIFFSIFLQAAEGSTFGIVPYVDKAVTGSVVGFVGAGTCGNATNDGFGLRHFCCFFLLEVRFCDAQTHLLNFSFMPFPHLPGGNIGGVIFAVIFVYHDYAQSFLWMGCAVVASAFLTTLVRVPGHRNLFSGSDNHATIERRQNAKPPAIIFIPAPADDSGESVTVKVEDASSAV